MKSTSKLILFLPATAIAIPASKEKEQTPSEEKKNSEHNFAMSFHFEES
jgi:hypothetical protein